MSNKFTHADICTKARFAGQVKRYHTWPVFRNQTTGEHTWQVMRIYWQIFGPMTAEVSTFILWHDAGELVTGDYPGMFKTMVPEVKPLLDRAERLAVDEMGGSMDQLDGRLKFRAKACDLIDVYEQCSIERLQGNRLVEGGVTWAQEQLEALLSELPAGDKLAIRNYMRKHKAWCNR
jgi:5'-deoxynucleotidase YfbR-like HD superfamily hydrolase